MTDVDSTLGVPVGPCAPWPVITCCDLTSSSPAVTGSAVQAASEVMWMLSGRQFGMCTVTLRPCRDSCNEQYGSAYPFDSEYWPKPVLFRGLWYNLTCDGGCMGGCSCNTISQFTLPRPIASITNITVDGVTIATGSYRVDDYRKVVRTDGGIWPVCNDLSKNSGIGAWSITVTYGTEIPTLGLLAAGELMCQFVKACEGQTDCQLPKRVQSLTRQGVTMAFLDPQEFLHNGMTGLYLPDLFINVVNPQRLAQPSRVYSPDLPEPRARTF